MKAADFRPGDFRHLNESPPFTFVLLLKILICRYQGVRLSSNIKLRRTFPINFSALIRTKLLSLST